MIRFIIKWWDHPNYAPYTRMAAHRTRHTFRTRAWRHGIVCRVWRHTVHAHGGRHAHRTHRTRATMSQKLATPTFLARALTRCARARAHTHTHTHAHTHTHTHTHTRDCVIL